MAKDILDVCKNLDSEDLIQLSKFAQTNKLEKALIDFYNACGDHIIKKNNTFDSSMVDSRIIDEIRKIGIKHSKKNDI